MKEFLIKYRQQIIISAIAITVLIGAVVAGLIRDRVGFSVVSGYQSTVRVSITATQDTVPVSSLTLKDDTVLTMGALGSVVFLTVEPGKSKEEIIMCTDIATTTLAFTNCTRGLAFSGTSTISVSGNRKTHNAGSIVTLSNVHYVYEQLVDKDANETASGTKRFASNELIFGDGTTTGEKIFYFCDSVATSTCGFIKGTPSSTAAGYLDFYLSPNGSSQFSLTASGTIFTASTTRAIFLMNGELGVTVSSTGGLEFNTSGSSPGALQLKLSTSGGLKSDLNGLSIDLTDTFAFSSTNTVTIGSSTFNASSTANAIPIAMSNGTLEKNWFSVQMRNHLLNATTTNGEVPASSAVTSTIFGTSTIPANVMGASGTIHVQLDIDDFDLNSPGSSDNTATTTLVVNGVNLLSLTMTNNMAGPLVNFLGTLDVFIINNGTSAQEVKMQLRLSRSQTNVFTSSTEYIFTETTSASIDTTQNWTMLINGRHGGSVANRILVGRGYAEIINTKDN